MDDLDVRAVQTPGHVLLLLPIAMLISGLLFGRGCGNLASRDGRVPETRPTTAIKDKDKVLF